MLNTYVEPDRDLTVRDAGPTPAAALRAAHLDASRAAARLDLDDPMAWEGAQAALVGITAEAYLMAATLTGEPPAHPAGRVSPVVRLRELAAAQGQLFSALEQCPPSHAQVHRSVQAVRARTSRLVPFRE